jgi:hypothetical protein
MGMLGPGVKTRMRRACLYPPPLSGTNWGNAPSSPPLMGDGIRARYEDPHHEQEESQQGVRRGLHDKALPPALEQQLLAKAEGNPFSPEELASTLSSRVSLLTSRAHTT